VNALGVDTHTYTYSHCRQKQTSHTPVLGLKSIEIRKYLTLVHFYVHIYKVVHVTCLKYVVTFQTDLLTQILNYFTCATQDQNLIGRT